MARIIKKNTDKAKKKKFSNTVKLDKKRIAPDIPISPDEVDSVKNKIEPSDAKEETSTKSKIKKRSNESSEQLESSEEEIQQDLLGKAIDEHRDVDEEKIEEELPPSPVPKKKKQKGNRKLQSKKSSSVNEKELKKRFSFANFFFILIQLCILALIGYSIFKSLTITELIPR